MADSLPNKCDFCGLCAIRTNQYRGSTALSDHEYTNLKTLEQEGIVEAVPPHETTMPSGITALIIESTTKFCAVNASAWNNKLTSCRYWKLRMDGASLSDYLTIYHTQRNQEIATGLALLAIVVTVVLSIIQLSS